MGDVHYMISEAAKHVGVESHVLRYWEEELDLPIGRTEMGHRHYTEEDIQLFSCIKELKEQGLLLKEIKQLLPDMLRTKALLKARKSDAPKAAASINEVADPQDPALSVYTADNLSLSVYQPLLEESLRKILLENNQILEGSLGKSVSEKVTKEMDFLLQAKERLEEDRYRKLDHLLRQQQALRKEIIWRNCRRTTAVTPPCVPFGKLFDRLWLNIEATVHQSFFCHGFLNCCQIRTIPVSSSAVCMFEVFRFFSLFLFPLFPYTHNSAVEPSPCHLLVLHTCNSVVKAIPSHTP